MKDTERTYYLVRVVRTFLRLDRSPETLYVTNHLFSRVYRLSDDRDKATRFESLSKGKRALNYTCVREALQTSLASVNAKTKVYMTSVKHVAELVKVKERTSYETEILASIPEKSPLEQLAQAAGDN